MRRSVKVVALPVECHPVRDSHKISDKTHRVVIVFFWQLSLSPKKVVSTSRVNIHKDV